MSTIDRIWYVWTIMRLYRSLEFLIDDSRFITTQNLILLLYLPTFVMIFCTG